MRVLFIPIDNRPCTFKIPLSLSYIAKLDIVHPPSSLLGDFHRRGDSDKILKWMETLEGTFDFSIICLDMLLYGGLVASRSLLESQKICLDRLRKLWKLLKNNNKWGKIYLFESLMRASPTFTDPKMVKIGLSISTYFEMICKHKRGEKQNIADIRKLRKKIPKASLLEYVKARRRNHIINLRTIENVASAEHAYLLIGMDDSKKEGLNVWERDILQKKVNDLGLSQRVKIVSGTDEGGSLLMAKAFVECKGKKPSFHIIYSYPSGKSIIPIYEDRAICDIIEDHINVVGGKISQAYQEADILLYAHVPKKTQKEASCQISLFDTVPKKWLISLKNSIEKGKRVAVIDLFYANGGDLSLFNSFKKHGINPLSLYSYAGWNTSGNSIGTVISHSSILYSLPEENVNLKEQIRFILNRIMDDVYYQSYIRRKIRAVMSLKGISTFNMGDKKELVEKITQKMMKKTWDKFQSNFINKKTLRWLGKTYEILNIPHLNVTFPWSRLFEIEVKLENLSLQNLPHL